MAEDRSTIILPDNSHPGYSYPAFGGFGNGFGSFNSIADLFGLAIIASMFGWGGGNWGGFGGGWGGGNGAGFLSNQLNNDSGRELIMNAINAQGEASRTAVSNLATALGQDFNLVNSGVQNVQNALQTLALQQAVSVPQIMNSIASGDASIISAFQKCCCDNQLAICQQTNALQSDIAGVRTAIEAKAAADQLAMCQQTYALTDTMNRNYLSLDNKIDALESSRKDREITALTAQVAKLESQNFTAGVVQQADAPDSIVEHVQTNVLAGRRDEGFTYSDPSLRRSVVAIGRTSTGPEFLNTTIHEIVHLALHIAEEDGIDPYAEDLAYLIGDITHEISDIVCELSCPHCNK